MSASHRRSGVLAKKVGMTRMFDEAGKHISVTVLSLDDCRVVGQRQVERDGYCAVIVGAGVRSDKHVSKPMLGVFRAAKVAPAKKVVEFRVDQEKLIEVGAFFQASHFVAGQFIDARARSVGKGFAGAMKRHNFGGLRASHGVSISHRSHGSTGHRREPGKVFKGKRMAGHMGARNVCQPNLRVVRVDEGRGLILVRGAVPGAAGCFVELRDAAKRPLPEGAPEVGGFSTFSQVAGGGASAPASQAAADSQ